MSNTRLFIVLGLPLITLALAGHSRASASSGSSPCTTPELLTSDRSHHQELSTSSPEGHRVAILIAEPGWLAVEVESTDASAPHTWWELEASACGPAARVLEKGLDAGLIEVREPGALHLRLGTLDGPPAGEARSFRLASRFFPSHPVKDDDNETEESEILPKGDDNETEESEILPNNGCGACGCSPEPGDDLMLCATPLELGETVSAELSSPSQDDLDHYTFSLDQSQVVAVFTTGAVDTLGTLYDDQSRGLTTADGGGEGENLAFTASLPAGTYFLRVEGVAGSEGAYELTIE